MSLGKIDHIVVLMLENRSFDSMLGKLYPKSATFDGLDGTEQNPDSSGVPVQVWSSTGTDESTMRIPDPDPGELWTGEGATEATPTALYCRCPHRLRVHKEASRKLFPRLL